MTSHATNRARWLALACLLEPAWAGCAGDQPALVEGSRVAAEDGVSASTGALVPPLGADSAGSSLKWNGIYWNGIYWNGIYWNGIYWNGIAWDDLSPGQRAWHAVRSDSLLGAPLSRAADDPRFETALADPAARDLVRYIVECALPGDHTVTYQDAGGLPVTFSGLHGMAPEWQSAAGCDLTCQRSVSACVYARVNYHGERNVLSWRSGPGIAPSEHTAGMDQPGADEEASFHLDEGAVWGNLFVDVPELWICRGADTIIDLSLPGVDLGVYSGPVPMGAIRMCAGDEDCLRHVYAGPCWAEPEKACQARRGQNGAYYQCAGPGGAVYDQVLTIRRADFNSHADFVAGTGLDAELSPCAGKAVDAAPGCAAHWDASCVEFARAGAAQGCNESALLAPHSVLEVGDPLDRRGSTCSAYVCAVDGACCDPLGGWDSSCVDLAYDLCR